MSVVVRPAGPNDSSYLVVLRWWWRADGRGEEGLARSDFEVKLAAWMADHRDAHRAWLAETGDAVVGMAWLAVIERIPGPQRWQRLSGFVRSVYVLPESRDAGVGRQLIDAVVEAAEDVALDDVSVHPSERSFSLYRRAGFAEYSGVLEMRLGDA